MNRIFQKILKIKLSHQLKNEENFNIGCGDFFVKDWVNIALFPKEELRYGSIKKKNGAIILNYDLKKGLAG